MIEPGRYLVGDAGLLRATVLLVARHGGADDWRWVYLDAGRYNGLPETQRESIQYHIRTSRLGGAMDPVILAGPTLQHRCHLRARALSATIDLDVGDTVDFLSAGAYTASYASVEFNGFPPLPTYCI